jgi:hypothetical protein
MFRAILSVAYAAFLMWIVLGRFNPTALNAEQGMWNVALVGIAALLYSSLNSFNALRHSIGMPTRVVYFSLLVSFLPLLVAVYSVAVWQYAGLSQFQIIAMIFGGLAAVIDLVLFSWLSFGHVRAAARAAARPAR